MIINFIKNEALDRLKADIPNNVSLYNSESRWIDEYFEEAGMSNYSFSTGIMVPDVELTIGDSKTDYENAVKLYEAFKGQLNPIQASDLRLWSFLAHNTYWNYMRTRWAIDDPSEEDEEESGNKLVSRIGTRYFFKASKGKAFVRQGIARLYWSAYLTYDEENEDPYEITKYLFSKQDIFVASTERALARDRMLLVEALRVLKESGDLKRADIRSFFLNLNQAGGVLVFDSLKKSDAYDLAKKTLSETLEAKSEDEPVSEKEDNPVTAEKEKIEITASNEETGNSENKVISKGSKVIIRKKDSNTRIPIVVGKSNFQTKPDLMGLRVGDKVKMRDKTWFVESVD